MPATLEQLVTIRSQVAEDLQRYYETLIKHLDYTPWHRDGKRVLASDISIPARVFKEETKPLPKREPGETDEDERHKKFDHPNEDPVRARYYEEQSRFEHREEVAWEQEQAHVKRAVILGAPGGGKSFLTRMTVIRFAKEARSQLKESRSSLETLLFPIHLELADLAQQDLPSSLAEGILKLLWNKYGKFSAPFMMWVRTQFDTTSCWLILDALDEVHEREHLLKRLKALETQNWNCRVILTCRVANYDPSQIPWNKIAEYELAPFKHAEIQQFTEKWFERDHEQGKALQQVLNRNYSLSHACRNPLVTTLTCLAHEEQAITEETRRGDLYALVLRGLIRGAWKEYPIFSKNDPHIDDVRELLQATARTLFEQSPESNQFTNSEIINTIKRIPDFASSPQSFRDRLLDCGILVYAGLSPNKESQYSFLHRTFLEYLTACSLAQQANEKGWESIKAFIDKKAWHLAWQEVIVLLAGQLDDPISLLKLLADEKKDDYLHHRLALASLCLLELPSSIHNSPPEIIEQITTDIFIFAGNHFIEQTDDLIPHVTVYALPALGHLGQAGQVCDQPLLDTLALFLDGLERDNRMWWIAIWMVEKIGSAAATPEILASLTNLLDDHDNDVCKAAMEAIEGLGVSAAKPEVLASLTDLSEDLDTDIRKGAANTLKGFGSAAAKPKILARLAALLNDPDEDVRETAVDTVKGLGSAAATPEFLTCLTYLLDNSDRDGLETAVNVVRILGRSAATPEIRTRLINLLLSNQDWHILSVVAKCFEYMPITPQFLSCLVNQLNDSDGYIRGRAASVVGFLGNTASTPAILSRLTEMLDDWDDFARWKATEALGDLGSKAATSESLAHLANRLFDPVWEIQIAATTIAVRGLGNAMATPQILAGLVDLFGEVSEISIYGAARETLESLRSAAAIPELLTYLEDLLNTPVDSLQGKASVAVACLGSVAATPEILARLTDLLNDSDNELLRRAVIIAIGRLGEAAATPEILDSLTDLLDERNSEVLRTVIRSIGELGEKAAKPEILARLTDLLDDPDNEVRIAAIGAVEGLGDVAATPEILDSLTNLLDEQDNEVLSAVIGAIGRLGEVAVKPEILDRLTDLLGEPDNEEVWGDVIEAVKELGNLAATPEILTLLLTLLVDLITHNQEIGFMKRFLIIRALKHLMAQDVRIFELGDGRYEGRNVEELSRIGN